MSSPVDQTGKDWMAIGETDDPDKIVLSFTAGAAITKGDPVYISDNNEVSPATSAQNCIGIALANVTAGKECPVLVRGRVKVKAGGAIAAGQAVYGADSSKRVLALADQAVDEGGSSKYTVYYNRKLGYALEAADTAGDLIFIYVTRA
jgi:hypothetical protein